MPRTYIRIEYAKDVTIAFLSTSALLLTLVLAFITQRSLAVGLRPSIEAATFCLFATVVSAVITLYALAGLREETRRRPFAIGVDRFLNVMLLGQVIFFVVGLIEIVNAIMLSLSSLTG